MCGEPPTTSSKASLDGAAEKEEESSEEKEQRDSKESEVLSNFLNCSSHSGTLLSAMAISRTPRDKYIRVTASEEAEVMKTKSRAADRGKRWEGSQHLRHWKAGGCPSDVYGESQRVSCSGGYLSHETGLSENRSPAYVFINPSTSQPQGSACDVQVAGNKIANSLKTGL